MLIILIMYDNENYTKGNKSNHPNRLQVNISHQLRHKPPLGSPANKGTALWYLTGDRRSIWELLIQGPPQKATRNPQQLNHLFVFEQIRS